MSLAIDPSRFQRRECASIPCRRRIARIRANRGNTTARSKRSRRAALRYPAQQGAPSPSASVTLVRHRYKSSCPSVRLYSGRFDYLAPLFDLGSYERTKLFGAAADRLEAITPELRLHVGH